MHFMVLSYLIILGPSFSITYAFDEIYRIPLRVHLGKSERPLPAWIPILEEINHIWLSQTGICFEMGLVLSDDVMNEGMDIWFVRGDNEIYNGMFRGEHDIWTKDTPILRPALNPAQYPAARTAAHELGHGLGLAHHESSDDHLMRSQTFGWKLDEDEIRTARARAEHMAHQDRTHLQCGPPRRSR